MTAIKTLLISLWILLLLAGTTACGRIRVPWQDAAPTPDQPQNPIAVDPHAKAEEREIVLYFKHEFADLLVPERRIVLQDKQTEEQLILQELLKGPQAFERRAVMPPGTALIDVVRRGETVFVNLTEEFLGDIPLAALPGKELIPEEEIPRVQAEMKRLSIYSIVHSLTFLDGVNQVKLLVESRQLSYAEMDAELLLEEGTLLTEDSPMMAIPRNQAFNLSPSDSVYFVLNQWTGETDWDKVYPFLSDRTMDNSSLPPLQELKARFPAVVGGYIEFEGYPILEEEFLMDKAFVTVRYTLKLGAVRREVREVLTVDNRNLEGLWKVRLPEFFSQFR